MKNILVPTDFSNASNNATEYAAALAQDFNASLILLNVIVPPIVIEDTSASDYIITEAELTERSKELLNKEIESVSNKFNLKVHGFIRQGSPTDFVQEFIQSKNVDLVVMGMKGRGKSNSIFGSTTVMVMRKSKVPVFVIPGNTSFTPVRNITFASEFVIDHTDQSILEQLSEKYQSNIRVLNVQKNKEVMSVENAIGKVDTDLSFVKFPHSFNTIESENIEKGINDFLVKNPSDILVMVAHRHSFIKRTFGTVHTKNMCYQTTIPLLVLHDSYKENEIL